MNHKNDSGILLIAMIVFAVLLVVVVGCKEQIFQDERLIPYWEQCPCKREVSLLVDAELDAFGQYVDNEITIHPFVFNYDDWKISALVAHEIGHSIGKDHEDPGMKSGRWFTIDNQTELNQMYKEICDL